MWFHVLHSYHTLSFFLFSRFKFFSFLCHSFHLPNLQNQTSSKSIFQKLWIGVSSQMIIFEKKSYAGNYAIYGYLLSNVKIKWRILPTTKICWNPLLIPRLFPKSNLYFAQLPLNLILHPNGIGNNSDLWPSVVIGTLTIFNQWNKNWCQRKRDVKNPFSLLIYHFNLFPYYFKSKIDVFSITDVAFSHSSLNAWSLYS